MSDQSGHFLFHGYLLANNLSSIKSDFSFIFVFNDAVSERENCEIFSYTNIVARQIFRAALS